MLQTAHATDFFESVTRVTLKHIQLRVMLHNAEHLFTCQIVTFHCLLQREAKPSTI
ncbi:hypothetical protein [Achromobacter phage SE2]|nr:hypothetical protein [Achromobacter phage SE2]